MITLTLPWPPSVNHSHNYGNKRKFLSKPTQKFREEVQEIVINAKAKMPVARLAMFVAFYPPDKRRRDICNYEKQLTDALVACGCIIDDELLDFVWLVRRPVTKGGKAVVVLVENEQVGEILNKYQEFL